MNSFSLAVRIFSMELRRMISYRSDFWVNFIGQTLISMLIAYSLWYSIFEYNKVSELNGYTLPHIIFYYLMAPLIFRIAQGDTIGGISTEIYEGGLNKYLLYPINFLSYKITTYFANAFFYFLQLILILFLFQQFFDTSHIYQFSLIRFFQFFLVVILCTTCYFFLNSLSELTAFWADYIWSLGVMIRFGVAFLGGSMIPLAFYPVWAQNALAFTPFPYLIHFPIQVILNQVEPLAYMQNIIILSFWILFFFLCSQYLWRKGQLQYSGIGI